MKTKYIQGKMFTPDEIALKDDALHKKDRFTHIETWYYDAVFDNNYSIVCLINHFKIGRLGLILAGLFIYRDGVLIESERKKFFQKHFFGSDDAPLIKIKNKEIIRGMQDKKTGNWIYFISMGDKKLGFDLQFETTTKGWSGKTYLGNRLAIPRYKVTGNLFVQGKNVNVTGTGYHDHNIYPFSTPLKNKGYIFGKITEEPVTITWAEVIKNIHKRLPIVVINNENEYFSIPIEDIKFNVVNQMKDNGKVIPKTICLQVKNKQVDIDITMDLIQFHRISMPAFNYWRYHLKNTGKITVDSTSKIINHVEIAEYLKFF